MELFHSLEVPIHSRNQVQRTRKSQAPGLLPCRPELLPRHKVRPSEETDLIAPVRLAAGELQAVPHLLAGTLRVRQDLATR